MKSIGTLSDVSGSAAPPPENDILARIGNLERSVLLILAEISDINARLDQAAAQPKSKAKSNGKSKAKPTPPSELVTELLKAKGAMSRAEMQQHLDLDDEAIKKCLGWMRKNQLAVKHDTEKDADGNSRWFLCQ